MEAFDEALKDVDEILIDGTENDIERPVDNEQQRQSYSGKKSRHTDVSVVISDKERYIHYISELYEGCSNDMGVLQAEFEPGKPWFSNKTVVVDLGFIGIEKRYDIKELIIGFKRKRKKKGEQRQELNEWQKQHNKEVSRRRIYVEHAIGGMKRFRVLKNKSRIKSYIRKNMELGICAALHNYKLRCNASIYW